jgi:hypothetical protein
MKKALAADVPLMDSVIAILRETTYFPAWRQVLFEQHHAETAEG